MPGLVSAEYGVSAPAQRLLDTRWGLRRPSGRDAARFSALIAAYWASAHLGYALQFAGPVAAIVWLPVGVAIAFLYFGGPWLWPAVLIGDLLVNDYHSAPVFTAALQSAGNVLEVLLAATLLRRVGRRGNPLDSLGGVAAMGACLVAGTSLSATIGVSANWLGDVISSSIVPHAWLTWVLGDLCGALIVVPFALAWAPSRGRVRAPNLEAVLLLAAIVVVGEIALHSSQPVGYLVFPALVWAALRFGARGATVAIVVVSAFTIWGTTHYVGPFSLGSTSRNLFESQLYLVIVAGSTLAVAALVSEREAFASSLRSSRARLVTAADTERRRLERNLHDGAQQRLVAVAASLTLVADDLDDPSRAGPLLESTRAEVLVAIEELRELAHGIHPAVLREFGLRRAIEAAAVRSTAPVELEMLPAVRVDATAEATAYYVVLEALTNAEKHSRASAIRIRAEDRDGLLVIVVADDGIGGAGVRTGAGLEGLRDRVEAMGGRLLVDSLADHGTRVEADIPVSAVVGPA